MDAARKIGLAEDPPAPAPEPARPTPVMEQYIEIKAANPDCLRFYRMGDFYELFFEESWLPVTKQNRDGTEFSNWQLFDE